MVVVVNIKKTDKIFVFVSSYWIQVEKCQNQLQNEIEKKNLNVGVTVKGY